jgi:hypothetical protein
MSIHRHNFLIVPQYVLILYNYYGRVSRTRFLREDLTFFLLRLIHNIVLTHTHIYIIYVQKEVYIFVTLFKPVPIWYKLRRDDYYKNAKELFDINENQFVDFGHNFICIIYIITCTYMFSSFIIHCFNII